jgi:cell division protein FtsB
MSDDLEKRVELFMLLELAGEPQMMPVGTFNLVWDLLCELLRVRAEGEQLWAERTDLEAANAALDRSNMELRAEIERLRAGMAGHGPACFSEAREMQTEIERLRAEIEMVSE